MLNAKKEKWFYPALLLCVLVPVLISLFRWWVLFPGDSGNFLYTINDEISWFKQIEAFVGGGMPLGYYGYDGSFARIGSSGPWGVVPMLPYVLFGKVFGWTFISPVFANVLFLSLASFLFVLLAKCDAKEILCFSLMMSMLHSAHIFAKTGMVEALRVSVTIIAVGAIIRFWREEKVSKIYKYAVLPAILVLTSQISILLAVLFPVYVYLLLREHRFGKTFMCDFVLKTLIIGFSSVFFLFANYLPLFLTSCSYPLYNFNNIIHTFFSFGVFATLKQTLNFLFSGFLGLDPTILISSAAVSSKTSLQVWVLLLWWLVIGFTVYMIIKNKKEHSRFFCKENESLWAIVFLNAIYMSALNIMYAGCARERQVLLIVVASILFGFFAKYKQYLYMLIVV
ncbi:MAG: hypothetical protein RSG78_06300, partial [Oscillospiraceae bacterium]